MRVLTMAPRKAVKREGAPVYNLIVEDSAFANPAEWRRGKGRSHLPEPIGAGIPRLWVQGFFARGVVHLLPPCNNALLLCDALHFLNRSLASTYRAAQHCDGMNILQGVFSMASELHLAVRLLRCRLVAEPGGSFGFIKNIGKLEPCSSEVVRRAAASGFAQRQLLHIC